MNRPYLALFSAAILIVLLSSVITQASKEEVREAEELIEYKSDLRFIANQGQWDDTIRYAVKMRGGHLMMEKQGLTYQFFDLPKHKHPRERDAGHPHHDHEESEEMVRGHVLKVKFEGSNPSPKIGTGYKYPDYYNYFIGNDPSRWAGKVGLYAMLNYEEVYEGIDFRIYGSGDNIKYDFIVAPHGDPSEIRVSYDGAEQIFIKDKALHVITSVRRIIDQPPYAFQEINGRKIKVPCEYRLEGNELYFVFPGGYDYDYELVIDPTLDFSTYTGAFSDNWGFTATYDAAGSLYAGGIVYTAGGGPTSYPTTSGAFQRVYRGGATEAAITKFNPNGSQREYSTFLGGAAIDQPHSLVVNGNNELYIFGRTSSSNFPVSATGYDRIFNGGFDLYVVKLDSTGSQLLGGTFLGGTGNDGENGNYFATGLPPTILQYNYGDDARGEVILDSRGDVLIAACTKSVNFPTTPGAFQRSFGGSQDGVVAKFNGDLTNLIWSSYLGGNLLDAAYGMKVDNNDNLYVTGGTNSTNFPTTPGSLNRTYQGGTADGFIAKIHSSGSAIMAATYVGTSSYDQSYLIDLDDAYNVYVSGQTMGAYPVTSNVYSVANSRQFITKLDNNLASIQYSTRFGSANAAFPNISPTAFLVDRCDNVYVAGWGGTTNFSGNTTGMPTTSDALQRSTDGSDFYMIVVDRDARNLLYATYLGGNNTGGSGEHVDGGTSRFDREGIVYHAVCASCGGFSTFPTTPGVVSNTNNSANCNLAAFKISFDLAGVEAKFRPLDKSNQPFQFTGCAPFLVNFDNLTKADPASLWVWDFGDGSPIRSTKEPTHTYQNPGTYEVMMVVIDSTTCNIFDTAYAILEIFEPPVAAAGSDEIICKGDSVLLTGFGAGNGGRYLWGPSGSVSPPSGQSTYAFPNDDTGIILTVIDSNGCRDTDTLMVTIDRSLIVIARQDTEVCEGVTVQLGASSNGISWSWEPGNTLNNPDIINPMASPDTTTTYVITAISTRGCEEKDSVTVNVYEVYTLSDTSICIGDTILLQTTNGQTFGWGPDYNMSNPNVASPFIWPDTSTTYTVLARSADGCFSEKSVRVTVNMLPTADAGLDDTVCYGFSTQLSANGGVNYFWNPVDFVDNPFIFNPTVTPDTTTDFVVTAIDANGCKDEDVVRVVVNDLPDVIAGPELVLCEGESIQLFAAGAETYIWDFHPSLSALDISNPTASPDSTTTYHVTGTDANGCQNDTSITIDVTARPNLEIEGVNYLCVGGAIELTAFGGTGVVWSTGDTSRTIELYPTGTMTVYATVYQDECRGETDTVVVDPFYDYPEANFNFDPKEGFAPMDVNFINLSIGADRYEWDFGVGAATSTDINPSFTFPYAGTWTVRLIAYSITGCPDTLELPVSMENVALHVPTGFSPNNDGHNDQFYVGAYGIKTMNIKIFSRWGMMIYESDNIDFRWDGRYQNRDVPEGVYVWVVKGVGENDLKYEKSGTVTLIR